MELLPRLHQPFWGPLAAILDFAGSAALQAPSLLRWYLNDKMLIKKTLQICTLDSTKD